MLDAVFTGILDLAFPADELPSPAELRTAIGGGGSQVIAALDAAGTPVAVAIGESFPSGTLLLSHLAVSPHRRRAGIGGQLLGYALEAWQTRYAPRVIFAELEHPAAHRASTAGGDPVARLRFYARHGGRALPVPYFQPALGPGRSRVYGMILAALRVGPDGAGTVPDSVDPEPVRGFLRGYFERTEGPVPTDRPTRALFVSLDGPEGVPLLPLEDPAALPVSTAE